VPYPYTDLRSRHRFVYSRPMARRGSRDDDDDYDYPQPPRPVPVAKGPGSRAYAIAMDLILGGSPADIAKAHGVELTYVLTSPEVIEAEKRLQHLHKFGPSAARAVLLDSLPDVLNALVAVAGDPGHKAWGIATKMYLDRVMPVIETAHVHHTHAVDVASKEAIASASKSLEALVNQLGPKVLEITAGRDIESRVLRGDAAKPTTMVIPERVGSSEQ
jgi:hypothetical protein